MAFMTRIHYLRILESTDLSVFSNRDLFCVSYHQMSVLVVKILSR